MSDSISMPFGPPACCWHKHHRTPGPRAVCAVLEVGATCRHLPRQPHPCWRWRRPDRRRPRHRPPPGSSQALAHSRQRRLHHPRPACLVAAAVASSARQPLPARLGCSVQRPLPTCLARPATRRPCSGSPACAKGKAGSETPCEHHCRCCEAHARSISLPSVRDWQSVAYAAP